MNKLENARLEINDVDQAMVKLFERRMKAVKSVIEYKMEHGLPIFDQKREMAVIEKNVALIQDESLKSYYKSFIQSMMDVSKQYQENIVKYK